MSKSDLYLRIISTAKIEYDNKIDMVILPGEDGEFGILAHHMNMIASLKQGVITIHADGKIDTMDINGGVASVCDGSKIDLLLA
jgi:F-type H+-transporting ATPase subunit epsilon